MSAADVCTTIMQMIASDFVELMAIIGGTAAISWVIKGLVNWTSLPLGR